MTRHFLDVTDIDGGELRTVLALPASDDRPLLLHRQGMALLFEKPSNRTRHSMEMAVVQLGGHPVYARPEEIDLDVRESVEDATRILAGYHAGLAARVFDHDMLVRMACVSTVPVINLLSDRSHPMQALADVLTMQEVLGDSRGRTVAYVGDYNNVARSLVEAGALLGMHVRIAQPARLRAGGGRARADDRARRALGGTRRRSVRGGEGRQRRAHRHVDLDGSGDRRRQRAERRSPVHGHAGDDGDRGARRRSSTTACRPTAATRSMPR